MSVVGIPEEDQQACLRVLAAVLHLGNVALQEDMQGEGSKVRGGGCLQATNVSSDIFFYRPFFFFFFDGAVD